jgi:hypothetical protein
VAVSCVIPPLGSPSDVWQGGSGASPQSPPVGATPAVAEPSRPRRAPAVAATAAATRRGGRKGARRRGSVACALAPRHPFVAHAAAQCVVCTCACRPRARAVARRKRARPAGTGGSAPTAARGRCAGRAPAPVDCAAAAPATAAAAHSASSSAAAEQRDLVVAPPVPPRPRSRCVDIARGEMRGAPRARGGRARWFPRAAGKHAQRVSHNATNVRLKASATRPRCCGRHDSASLEPAAHLQPSLDACSTFVFPPGCCRPRRYRAASLTRCLSTNEEWPRKAVWLQAAEASAHWVPGRACLVSARRSCLNAG